MYHGRHVDFHPRVRHPYPHGRLVVERFCELDPEVVRTREVERLIDTLDARGRAQLHRISHVPRSMTNFFLNMYNSRVQELRANIEAWTAELHTPGTSAERRRELRELIRQAEAELDRIEPYLAPLESYQSRLNEIEGRLRQRVEAEGP
jgi:hypothetical protein